MRSSVDSTECDWVDIAQNRMELINDGDVCVEDSVVHCEIHLVPHGYVHSEWKSVRLVFVTIWT